MKTQKTWLIFSLAFALLVLLSSCTSREERMLEGEWYGELQTVDDDGEEMILKTTLKFNRKKDLMTFRVGYAVPDYGTIAYVTFTGDYLADDKEITMYPDEDSVKCEYTDAIENYANAFGMDLSSFEELLELSLSGMMGIWEDIPIKSLKSDRLVLDLEGDEVVFHKK